MTQTKTSADRGSIPLESTTLEEKMKLLQNKWTSFACACLNAFAAAMCLIDGKTNMFVMCTVFAVWCGYNFVNQMEEK